MSTDKTNIKLNSRIVAAVSQFKAVGDIRYYICGVYVEPISSGGALIVATNGHSMCLWRDKTGVVDRAVILRTEKKLLAACASKQAKHLVLVDDRLTVTDSKNNELFVQPNDRKWEIEGTYPDWRRVIPDTNEAMTLFDAVNPRLLTHVEQALKIGINNGRYSGISLNQPAANGPIIVTCNSIEAENFLAVIMPLRESTSQKPKWVDELKPTAAAAAAKGGAA